MGRGRDWAEGTGNASPSGFTDEELAEAAATLETSRTAYVDLLGEANAKIVAAQREALRWAGHLQDVTWKIGDITREIKARASTSQVG